MPESRPLISFNMKPVRGPWGGSSPFVKQLAALLRAWGCRVCFDLRPGVDLIVLVDPRKASNKPYDTVDIRNYRRANPRVKVLHRVNECDARKGTDFMDALLEEASGVADTTVFISEWLRDYFEQKWFDSARDHAVIYNGADPRIFHPAPRPAGFNRRFRLITHHWSNHWMKGFDVYREVDRLIASGELPGVELVVVGRWPEDLQWQAAELHPACSGHRLARLLRTADAYLTASRREPCGMHHIEGAQCGLPLLYHEDGGGINEAGRMYGIGFRDGVVSAIHRMQEDYEVYRTRVLRNMPCGTRMAREYAGLLLGTLSRSTPDQGS
jgi:glycosyltransferase involved in cell wall biosynthesis